MTDDIRAAVEYVRKPFDDQCAMTRQRMQERLADAYLAEHPADDADPVTGEWLTANGFHRPMQPASSQWYTSDACVPQNCGPVLSIEFPRTHKPDVVPVWYVFVYGYLREFNHCPTRGYIRRLLAVLR